MNASSPLSESELYLAGDSLPMQTSCPVCMGASHLFDVVDAGKSCLEGAGISTPLIGRAVYYHCCEACGFIHSESHRRWRHEDFKRHIYNDDYLQFDPDHVEKRPTNWAAWVNQFLGANKALIRHADYGGGNGRLSECLREHGWESRSFDPFYGDMPGELAGTINLITAFEVFEHVPDPHALVDDILQLFNDEEQLLIFSTLISDGEVDPPNRLAWWYAGPRNGHVSLFSRDSLNQLFASKGWIYAPMNNGLHIACKSVPSWAASVLRLEEQTE